MKKLSKTHYYKVFEDKHLTCQDMRFEFGKIYRVEGEVTPCENGFHACKELVDCFNYKTFHLSMRVCIVQLGGVVKQKGDKTVGQTLRIVRELPFWEIDELVNEGKYNIGYGNKGNGNKGNGNKGNENKGDWNEGDRNKGNGNKGNENKGDWNEGDRNKGNRNIGNGNKGNENKGDWNKGNRNEGNE